MRYLHPTRPLFIRHPTHLNCPPTSCAKTSSAGWPRPTERRSWLAPEPRCSTPTSRPHRKTACATIGCAQCSRYSSELESGAAPSDLDRLPTTWSSGSIAKRGYAA
eukprot:595682-Prymnesium_polylepis.2